MRFVPFYLLLIFSFASGGEPEWTLKAPRPEIATEGEILDGGALSLTAENREGLNGYWEATFPVEGGEWRRFSAIREAENVEHPRRSCAVRIDWKGDKGQSVTSPHPVNPVYFGTGQGSAKPDFPVDVSKREDGSVEVGGVYLVPDDAVTAVVQLHLRWSPGGSVKWSDVVFEKDDPPPPRKVRLAAVHHNLSGGDRTPEENRELLRPLVEKAAAQDADLIVLPEYLTCKGVTSDYVSVAEPIPGPTTDYFGALARKHDCYIVADFPERDGELVYNTAALIGPDGEVVGKYRKVALPRGEIDAGIAPGSDYPVFETRFGKVGMMVCYDVFFPEVARRLSRNGAEIIALPIWGGNPRLAAARCAENGVYLVSSTYTNHEHEWMKTAIWNREGDRLATADEWESVVVEEVDLSERTYWYGLGDFQARIAREGPVWEAE